MSRIGCCRVTLSMRYHFCLFSALQGVPFIAINRSGKVEDLVTDLEWPYACPLHGVRAPALADMLAEILETVETRRSRLGDVAARMRGRSLTNDAALDWALRG